ncbi:Flagellar biosynthetic protein FlhB [Marinobacterium sp. xm-d-420]|uniref:EscU/YscU/HrcU family type III secretion system export apparatus switch protein n=1 Tax=Marinobacterium sp. xm-d-420 TaxID=2497737 RepID=UPI0015699EA4|nr:EscU/YscU/HrcU family type III secretion system export apparatus switch protein [Marinobacterium sp. xm-d-420]NRP28709.1 Flagellar biosynthetic protein FlhB [Marinobacterium sp. xm-d-420]
MSKESIAIALEYGQNEAPVVTAKGRGELAKKIIEAARQAGVPIHRDEDFNALLEMLEMDQEVPESLYRVVAEVLAYSYWIRGMKPGDERQNSE